MKRWKHKFVDARATHDSPLTTDESTGSNSAIASKTIHPHEPTYASRLTKPAVNLHNISQMGQNPHRDVEFFITPFNPYKRMKGAFGTWKPNFIIASSCTVIPPDSWYDSFSIGGNYVSF